MLFRLLAFILVPTSLLFSFEKRPWLEAPYEFYIRPLYIHRFYPDIEGGINPTGYSSHDNFVFLDFGGGLDCQVQIAAELEFAKTTMLSFGLESVAFEIRKQLLNDIAGDPLSLTTGLNVRFVPHRRLQDPSTPYHYVSNFEANLALGKEFSELFSWCTRAFGFVGVGIANRGAPWIRFLAKVEGKFSNCDAFSVFTDGYFGFGNSRVVDVGNFNGYYPIRHSSVDVGIGYTHFFDIWGSLTAEVAYRPHARAYPERARTYTIYYKIPFNPV